MKSQLGRHATGVGAIALLVAALVTGSPASAAPSGAVPFGEASFHGYATGTEVHLGAITVGTTQVASVDQAFSGASTSTAGLTSVIRSETGSVVQPAEPSSVHAYGTGSGLEVGLATSTTAQTDDNQIILAGKAEQTAPPNTTATTKEVGPVSLPPVVSAAALIGRAAAIYSADQCPIGQPISYGLGDAADVNALDLTANTPVLNTAGTGTSTAQTTSDTYLSANGDGTFGLTSEASEIIAPVTVTIPDLGYLTVTVAGTTPNNPITLDAVTTGESTGASVQLHNADTVVIALHITATDTTTTILNENLATLSPGGVHVNLGIAGVVSLGTVDIDATPHAIGGAATSAAVVTGGTAASGAIDLVHLDLAVTTPASLTPLLSLANLYVGHLEASANLAAPITCSIPVLKTADPASVTAGQNFVYSIYVPNPAEIPLLSCNLDNITATDTITDKPGTGNPLFLVTSVNDGGHVSQTSATSATVTWTGLNYTVAKVGDPPNPPITLTVNVAVPADSPSGTIQDTVVATGTAQGCNGGASGTENLGNTNGTVLTGSVTLQEPSVTALPPGSKTPTGSTTPTTTGKLPFTGAIGGLWQPFAGLGVLGLGGGALALARRSRYRPRT